MHKRNFEWQKFPWQEAIIHFTTLLGAVHTDNLPVANKELVLLKQNYDTLLRQKDAYKANQVHIQMKAGEAWITLKEGNQDKALSLMKEAADMEDKTEKHPVTPSEIIPARELLADMLLQMNKPSEALIAYETDLQKHRNRFNGLYGAGRSAEQSGQKEKAGQYYRQLLSITDSTKTVRPEITAARKFLTN